MSSKNLPDLSQDKMLSEIFSNPLPQARQIHRNLKCQLEEKNAQLRTHVGGSYRQLLGTAETILVMNELIQKAEDQIAHVSHACGKNVIDHLTKGLTKFYDIENGDKRKEELRWLSLIKAIDVQCVMFEKLLHSNTIEDNNSKGKSLVTASKVLALSQPMVKSVEEISRRRNKECQKLVQNIKSRLSTLRLGLLRIIERTLKNISADDREDIIQALTSYSLVTGCGIKNVLSYFLHVRELAIANHFGGDTLTSNIDMVKSLILYGQTLLDTSKILPRGLSANLSQLRAKPLFMDRAVRDIEELRFDELERFLDHDVLSFAPLVEKEEIDNIFITDQLSKWDKKVTEVLLQGISQTLKHQYDLMIVFNLRTEILETWVKEGSKVKDFDSTILLGKLKDVVKTRILEIITQRSERLQIFGIELKKTVASWQVGISDKQESLWDRSIFEMGVVNGVALFQKSIIARTFGRNDTVSRSLSCYKEWRQLVDVTISIIEQIKKQRWDYIIEDLEEDVDLSIRKRLLSVDDAQIFQRHLEISLKKDFRELQDEIELLLRDCEKSDSVGQISIYILRIVRDIRSNLPEVESIRDFGILFLARLHNRLVQVVTKDCLNRFLSTVKKMRCQGLMLWEGDPKLPVQPSPAAFKLLYNLTRSMSEVGQDVWSSAAVLSLKIHLSTELSHKWSEILKEKYFVENSTNVEVEDSQNEYCKNFKREILIQTFFDFSFVVKNALQNPDAISSKIIVQFEELIKSQIELQSDMQGRINECAKNYWKKTSLLFGTLA